MGSGKSTVGKVLSRELSMEFVDLDQAIVEMEGRSISDIFASDGESYFRELEAKALREVTSQRPNAVIALGGGTPCQAGAMDYVLENGVVVYLKLSVGALVVRLSNAKHKRPLVADKSPQELRDFIEKHLREREIFYERAHVIVDNSTRNIAPLLSALEYYQKKH